MGLDAGLATGRVRLDRLGAGPASDSQAQALVWYNNTRELFA